MLTKNYWVYSAGLAVVWAIVLVVVFAVGNSHAPTFLLLFLGFFIGWVSGTIARYVYAPPRKWTTN